VLDRPSNALVSVPLIEVVPSQVLIDSPVLRHVVNGYQDGMGYRDDRTFASLVSRQAMILGREVVVPGMTGRPEPLPLAPNEARGSPGRYDRSVVCRHAHCYLGTAWPKRQSGQHWADISQIRMNFPIRSLH
jgi:hypothetical protein